MVPQVRTVRTVIKYREEVRRGVKAVHRTDADAVLQAVHRLYTACTGQGTPTGVYREAYSREAYLPRVQQGGIPTQGTARITPGITVFKQG